MEFHWSLEAIRPVSLPLQSPGDSPYKYLVDPEFTDFDSDHSPLSPKKEKNECFHVNIIDELLPGGKGPHLEHLGMLVYNNLSAFQTMYSLDKKFIKMDPNMHIFMVQGEKGYLEVSSQAMRLLMRSSASDRIIFHANPELHVIGVVRPSKSLSKQKKLSHIVVCKEETQHGWFPLNLEERNGFSRVLDEDHEKFLHSFVPDVFSRFPHIPWKTCAINDGLCPVETKVQSFNKFRGKFLSSNHEAHKEHMYHGKHDDFSAIFPMRKMVEELPHEAISASNTIVTPQISYAEVILNKLKTLSPYQFSGAYVHSPKTALDGDDNTVFNMHFITDEQLLETEVKFGVWEKTTDGKLRESYYRLQPCEEHTTSTMFCSHFAVQREISSGKSPFARPIPFATASMAGAQYDII